MKRILLILAGWLPLCAVFNLQLSTALAQGASFTLLTITNPTPAVGDRFGFPVAAMGNDRVLIAANSDDAIAPNAGAVYLLSTNGALLTTFTKPTPTSRDLFGVSVTALGIDRVLVGAPGASAAYLFSTNGELLVTFSKPTLPASEYFGYSLAAMGSNRVLIGAPLDDIGAPDSGAAYLFQTNGVLLTTFTNPTPAAYDNFGISVTAIGSDRVLIGAYSDDTGASHAGAAYLFNSDGALLTTFTNPTPAIGDHFGKSVAAIGDRLLLIGVYQDDEGSPDAGLAHLFSTNGTLLTTLTNPMPATNDYFSGSVTAVGSDKVLIAAHNADTGAVNAGVAYLFSTNGALLTTFTNPAPAIGATFGSSVAAMENERVLIGAAGDDTNGDSAGVAYLFSTAVPSLTIQRNNTTNAVAVSWPSPWPGWILQENTNGLNSFNWNNAPGQIHDDGTNKTLIINPQTGNTGNRFYRLFKP